MADSQNEIQTCFCCLQLLIPKRRDIVSIEVDGCSHKYCSECILNFMDLQKDDLLADEIITLKGEINKENENALKYTKKYNNKLYYCLQCENHFDATDIKRYSYKSSAPPAKNKKNSKDNNEKQEMKEKNRF